MMNIDISEMSPVEKHGGVFFKRDDLFEINELHGGKVRSAYQLITNGIENGFKNFVTAGSRHSPQVEIVSFLCEYLNVNCTVFIPRGKETSVIRNITNNKNTTIERTKVGYNNVICAYAKKFSEENNHYYIPFGMECFENIEVTSKQVYNIPKEVKRIVMPIGSGMSFISVLNGLYRYGMNDIEVLGIQVGKSPNKNIEKYLDKDNNIMYNIIKSEYDYDFNYKDNIFNGIELDVVYEAKCIPYIKQGDLLWIVGKRKEDLK